MKPARNGRDRGIYGTRRERAARVRREMVHAAGECLALHDCIVTSFWVEPTEALSLERESIADGDGAFDSLDLLRSGAVRIPRTLRAMWREALSPSEESRQRQLESNLDFFCD